MKDSNKFSDDIIIEAARLELTDEIFSTREEVIGITIDGETSKDLDDAIFVEKRENGYLVKVSIADVAGLIKVDSAIYREALQRVETRYFSGYNVPMLPPQLSENRLSLLENEMRPTLTFGMELNANLDVQQFTIQETFVKNQRQLGYGLVDEILDNKPDDPHYGLLSDCIALAERLLNKRRNRGALAIYDLQHLMFTDEEGQVLPLSGERANKGNLIIQELMILTNQTVARLFAKKDVPFLYRNHTVKQSTPERDEIIEQFNAALLNPTLLNTLSQRAALWFNRATYEPVLKGHFGLNEAAYTHVTSPIRRLPDLINQYIIKAYLTRRPIPQTHDNLVWLSEIVNMKMAQARDEKSEFLKEKAQAKARFQVVHATVKDMVNMDSNEFRLLLKQACRHALISDEFERAVLTRFEVNKIDVSYLYVILFESLGESEVWERLREKAMSFAAANPGYSSQLLHLLTQKGDITYIDVEVKDKQHGFLARIVANLDGGKFSTRYYAAGVSKKEAQHKASYNFINSYLKNSLVTVDQTREPEIKEIAPVNALSPEENFVGQLNDFCTGRAGWSMPSYQFTRSGPSHQPLITCDCKLETPGGPISAPGAGTNKKVAKQMASKSILMMLSEKALYFNNLSARPDAEIQRNNYISQLNEICQQNSWGAAVYEFEQSGLSHQPVFTCVVTVETPNGGKYTTGIGPSKKVAKQMAAKNLVKEKMAEVAAAKAIEDAANKLAEEAANKIAEEAANKLAEEAANEVAEESSETIAETVIA